ncbi:RibD family protein [Litorimonas sp. RW-G-Af-16]|uniref:RibD family protein n=1 Tax=Litorimonas sp. RW-G-Af-16 TaxID=3241168 RepID=UPI00390C7BF4
MRRPTVTLKLATSLDGKIALANGQSEWITGDESRAAGRRLRATHDAIAVGSNTAVLDNPQLTTRMDGAPNPIRIIFDSELRLSPDSELAQTANKTPVWVFCKSDQGQRADALKSLGVRLFPIAYKDKLDLEAALDFMFRNGVSTLLVEGGGTLAASFVKLGAIDRIEWFRAPLILGGDGRSGIGELGLTDLSLARQYTRIEVNELGDDLHERYERTV